MLQPVITTSNRVKFLFRSYQMLPRLQFSLLAHRTVTHHGREVRRHLLIKRQCQWTRSHELAAFASMEWIVCSPWQHPGISRLFIHFMPFACAKIAMTLCDRDQSRYEIEKLRSRYCSLIAFWSRPIIFGTRQASTRAVLDTPRSSHTQLTVVLRTYCPKQCILRPPHVITSHLAERQVTARHLACDCLCTTTWTWCSPRLCTSTCETLISNSTFRETQTRKYLC